MGTFVHPITIRNPHSGASLEMEAVVDRGATFTSLPRSLLERLGVPVARRVTMRLADGSLVESPLGHVEVQVDGEATPSVCLFGTEGSPAILGATTLQSLLLTLDVVDHRLLSVPGLLLSMNIGSLLLAPDPVGKRFIRLQGWLASQGGDERA